MQTLRAHIVDTATNQVHNNTTQVNNNSQVNNTTVNNTQVNITIRNFNHENMASVQEQVIADAVDSLKVDTLLRQIHWPPGYPENHNVIVKPDNTVEIYMQDRWQTVPWHAAITKLATQGLNVCVVFGKNRRDLFLDDGLTPEEYEGLVDRLSRCKNVPPNGMMDDAQRILGGKLQQARRLD
jgi:hypothetical protein